MRITIILCTFNRCGSLAKALDSIAVQTVSDSCEWEVLVVDNNSNDQTRQVVEDFCTRFPRRCRYLFEPQRGKSYALNLGIRESRSDVLAFVDDDVTVDRMWLHKLTAQLESEEWAGAGGRILPEWNGPQPRWLPVENRRALGPLAAFDIGLSPGLLTESPFGTNMAFRRCMFEKYGDFRTDLGPRPENEIRGEDTEFGDRLLAAGERLRYEPAAIVYHPVPPNRLRKDYFLRWWFDKGRTNIRQYGLSLDVIRWWGVPRRFFVRIAIWILRWLTAIQPQRRFDRKLQVWQLAGEIFESHSQFRGIATKRRAEKAISSRRALNLKAGEWVEVRSQAEILATLDERGCLENLPFMPEMLQYCGKRFRVFKRADKTCQYIVGWSIRRMENSVHLEGGRCDGTMHDGCEAGCLIFWKEAWLKRAKEDEISVGDLMSSRRPPVRARDLCTVESILAATQAKNSVAGKVYSCQATNVRNFTSYMKPFDPRQYIRDLRSGNLCPGLARDSRAERMLESMIVVNRILHAVIIDLFNRLQSKRHGSLYPFIAGTLEKTPVETLDLRPGDLVQVRSKEEILATLDKQNRNRGLLFDSEMLTYCGGIYRVLRRVHRMIDEKTGKMLSMKQPCIVLEGVACRSDYHNLCPRAIYHYWRENWLKRVSADTEISSDEQIPELCEKC